MFQSVFGVKIVGSVSLIIESGLLFPFLFLFFDFYQTYLLLIIVYNDLVDSGGYLYAF